MSEPLSSRTLVIERVFNAPRQLVWDAWTKPEHMVRWWGPRAFSCPTAKIDFRVGGKYLMSMSGPMPDGSTAEIWSTGTYKEIHPISKIVCTDSFADAEGNIVPSEHYGMAGFPHQVNVIVEFADMGNKTKMTLHHEDMPEYMGDDATTGWNESFDKLAELLETLR